jgi:DNA-binding GntR family transcriptional regulator
MVIKDEELATQLGISKTPLREALMQLSAEGLVDMPSNRLKRIAPLTRRSLLEIHFIYLMVRESAYRLGVPRLTDEDIRAMEYGLQLQKLAIEAHNWADATLQGRQFHEIVVKAADNDELYRLTRQYTHAIDRASIMLRPASERRRNHDTNLVILAAVKNGDTETAVTRMLEQARQLIPLLEALPEDAPPAEQKSTARAQT